MIPAFTGRSSAVAALRQARATGWQLHWNCAYSIDLEMTSAGPAWTEGAEQRVFLVLWWGERIATATLPVEAVAGDSQHLALRLREMRALARPLPSAIPPAIATGSTVDWRGDWPAQAATWQRMLARECRRNDGWQKRFELHLERNSSIACDARGACRKTLRHHTRVDVSVESARPRGAVWTMGFPMPTPGPHELGVFVEEAILHASSRARRPPLPGGKGHVRLSPYAVAQLMVFQAQMKAGYASSASGVVPVDRIHRLASGSAQEPSPRENGLYILHFEELLAEHSAAIIRGVAMARCVSKGGRLKSGVATIGIPTQRFRRALETDLAKTPGLRAYCFGAAEFHVPGMLLATLPWKC